MTRLLSGVVLAALALAALWWLPPPGLLAVVLVVAAGAFVEYARMAAAIGTQLPRIPALLATLAACATVAYPMLPLDALLSLALIATAVTVMVSGRHGPEALHDAAAAVLAPVYIGVPLGALVVIVERLGPNGALLLIGTVALSDTAQYYTGRTFGRRPLALRISPKKTLEGALGGVLITPAALALLAPSVVPGATPAGSAALGVGLVAAGIAGDLFESLLKRAAGLKDSGALIPGHGGILDRIDALLFAVPVFFLYLRLA